MKVILKVNCDFLEPNDSFKASPSTPIITSTYRYDGSGNRITKKVSYYDSDRNSNFVVNTLYLRDASGNTMAVMSDTTLESGQTIHPLFVAELPIYGSSRLGEFRPSSASENALSLNTRFYELNNHLGNVLVTLSDEGNVLSYSDYYPLGLYERKILRIIIL